MKKINFHNDYFTFLTVFLMQIIMRGKTLLKCKELYRIKTKTIQDSNSIINYNDKMDFVSAPRAIQFRMYPKRINGTTIKFPIISKFWGTFI